MHHMDADKTRREKARWKLHKNATSYIEQTLEATPTKQQLYSHLPPIFKTVQIRRTRHAKYCLRSKDQLIRDVLLWTYSHGCASVDRPARTYLHQLCADAGYGLKNLPGAMDERDGRRERESVRKTRVRSTT